MGLDGLDHDIRGILECRENEEFQLLQRLSAYCQDLHSTAVTLVETYLVQAKEYERKQETINDRIAQLYKVNKERCTERDNIVLQQKVTDKKIALAKSQSDKLKEEINEAKFRKESISLQMVDLAQEIEEARKQKKERWNAIKRACAYYKDNLNIHISLEEFSDHDSVKVTFFQRENPQRDNYCVILENHKHSWRVGQIMPAPEDSNLKNIIDLTKPLRVLDVVAFLCALRNVFSKHYIKE